MIFVISGFKREDFGFKQVFMLEQTENINMDLFVILFETIVIIGSAVVASLTAYMIFRDSKIALWAYVAAFIPRALIVLVTLTGATNLTGLTWLSHTAGIFVYPMLLAMGNILLIELSLAVVDKRTSSLPIGVKQAEKIQGFLGKLQNKKLLPPMSQVKNVYLAGLLAGLINLLFVVVFGVI